MKTFRYELGHVHYETMTVGELIAKLKEHAEDMPVIAEWETVCVGIHPDSFEVEKNFHGGDEADACDTLILNVDQHG